LPRVARFGDSVFINCPFDIEYWPIFEAIVFAVIAAGFAPRCALEELDSGTLRLDKIGRLIRRCRYGIHDLSRIELSPSTDLPRFNMPFELGLDVAARTFGPVRLREKRFLVLDAEPNRYHAFISDISGQDIFHHRNSPDRAIEIVRNWLKASSRRRQIAGPVTIKRQYQSFAVWLPENCDRNGFQRDDLQFIDYVEMAVQWIATSGATARRSS
jgi:hypothetical protein